MLYTVAFVASVAAAAAFLIAVSATCIDCFAVLVNPSITASVVDSIDFSAEFVALVFPIEEESSNSSSADPHPLRN